MPCALLRCRPHHAKLLSLCLACTAEPRRRQHSPTSLGLQDQMHFSSSSISFSTGPGGVSRASASRTTLAPGGVAEHQNRAYDGRTGQHRALHQQAVNGRVRSPPSQLRWPVCCSTSFIAACLSGTWLVARGGLWHVLLLAVLQ